MNWRHLLRDRVVVPILDLLKQGVTPERLALSLAIGTVLGISPVLGVTTALAFLICFVFRLNVVAMQLMNYLMYPLQIALLIPFIRAGEALFHAGHLRFDFDQIQQMIRSDHEAAVRLLGGAIWHAIVVWLIVAPIIIAIVYLIMTPVLRHAAERLHIRRTQLSSKV